VPCDATSLISWSNQAGPQEKKKKNKIRREHKI